MEVSYRGEEMEKAIMPVKCKNLIGSIFTFGLLVFVLCCNCTNEKPIEEQQVIVKAEKEPKQVIKELTRKDFEKLYHLIDDHNKDTCIDLSYEDAQILMKIAVLEDHTDEISQAYIMTLILNRLYSDDFPGTIREVIEQEGQFLMLDDSRYLKAEPDNNSHLALALVESGQITTDFLYYEALYIKDSWASRNREKACEYGGSRFYR